MTDCNISHGREKCYSPVTERKYLKKTYFCGINWQRWIATVYASIWRKVRTRPPHHAERDANLNI